MGTKYKGYGRHHIESPDACMIKIHPAQNKTGQYRDQIKDMAAWQGQRLTINQSGELAKGHDRTSGCNRTDKDADKDFHLMDDLFHICHAHWWVKF